MKKLLSILVTVIVPTSSTVTLLNNPNITANFMNMYSDKKSLLKLKFDPVIITYATGLNEENLLDEIFMNIIKNNPEHEELILNVSENKGGFKITGNDFKIPNENESNSYIRPLAIPLVY